MPSPITVAVKEGIFAIDRRCGRRDSVGAHPAAPTPPHHHSVQRRVEMLEEREASSEAKKLRADLTSMLAHIEVSLREFL